MFNRGARLYKLQIVLFKWASKIVWMDPTLQMLQVTKHTQDNTIKIRWLTNGKPRLLYPLMFFGRTPSLRYMDFFSTLKVGENEKIEVHRLSKVTITCLKPRGCNLFSFSLWYRPVTMFCYCKILD
eukprot:Seg763.3 transcript_id=Seg763.3/GoldUCD/mRNA.D3Y31 product="hypothetical protein" protein_id=Seg763.3/GoldUCD/D3Y31